MKLEKVLLLIFLCLLLGFLALYWNLSKVTKGRTHAAPQATLAASSWASPGAKGARL